MRKCQSVRATTNSGAMIQFLILEEGHAFLVLMEGVAFPPGTTFNNAEAATVAAVKALNAFLPQDDSIVKLHSDLLEEFISNSRMKELLMP